MFCMILITRSKDINFTRSYISWSYNKFVRKVVRRNFSDGRTFYTEVVENLNAKRKLSEKVCGIYLIGESDIADHKSAAKIKCAKLIREESKIIYAFY